MATQDKSQRQEHVDDASRAGSSRRGGARGALRFALWTVVNGVVVMIVLYLAGLLSRSHTAASYFQGLADDWESYVPTFLIVGAGLTLWNRWLHRRRRTRQAEDDDSTSGTPTD